MTGAADATDDMAAPERAPAAGGLIGTQYGGRLAASLVGVEAVHRYQRRPADL